MEISAIALGGMHAAEASLDQAASSMARPLPGAAPEDTVDLSSAAVAMISARNDFAANLASIQVDEEITKRAIELMR